MHVPCKSCMQDSCTILQESCMILQVRFCWEVALEPKHQLSIGYSMATFDGWKVLEVIEELERMQELNSIDTGRREDVPYCLTLQTLYPNSRGKDTCSCCTYRCGSLTPHECHYGIVLAVCRGMTTIKGIYTNKSCS